MSEVIKRLFDFSYIYNNFQAIQDKIIFHFPNTYMYHLFVLSLCNMMHFSQAPLRRWRVCVFKHNIFLLLLTQFKHFCYFQTIDIVSISFLKLSICFLKYLQLYNLFYVTFYIFYKYYLQDIFYYGN